jgi:hypothetical protein
MTRPVRSPQDTPKAREAAGRRFRPGEKFWIHLPGRAGPAGQEGGQPKGRKSWQIEDADRRILEHLTRRPLAAPLPPPHRLKRSALTIVEGSDDRHRNPLRRAASSSDGVTAARAAAPAPAQPAARPSPRQPAERGHPRPRRPESKISHDDYREQLRGGRVNCTGGSTPPAPRGSPACWSSRAGTPPARAA